jgi:uncharacterized protein YigE (DUF2233 family)
MCYVLALGDNGPRDNHLEPCTAPPSALHSAALDGLLMHSIFFNPLALPFVLAIMIWGTHARSAPTTTTGCVQRVFEGEGFRLCRYDPVQDDLALIVTGADGRPLRHLPALAKHLGPEARRVRFAMNAGMYDADGFPIGLYVEAGQSRHKINTRSANGNFYMKPNGVFWADKDGAAHIMTTETYRAKPRRARWATQSGPMLVIDGKLHPAISAKGRSTWTRNGVGTGCDGKTWFVISDAAISFGTFARLFQKELGCRNALFLDGAVSSLWEPRGGRIDVRHTLGPMVVVSDKSDGAPQIVE